jgi:predicted RNase H-like HicB family nuclease
MYGAGVNLHVAFVPDEQGWVRATIEELPSVITCAPTIDEARELVRDALEEWLTALTSARDVSAGHHARRETLTLSVVWV